MAWHPAHVHQWSFGVVGEIIELRNHYLAKGSAPSTAGVTFAEVTFVSPTKVIRR